MTTQTDVAEEAAVVARPARGWRRYPAYRDSGVEWLGEIPAHWQVKRLRFAALVNPSKLETSDLDAGTDVSFLPMELIGEDGTLRLERTKPIEQLRDGYTYFRDGDVLVAKITPCFENGKGALCDGLVNGIGFGTTELHVIRANGSMSQRFLFYLTRSHPFRSLGVAMMTGAAGQQRVPEDFVRDFRIALPSLAEQHAIAAFLDRETARIDALVAKKERLIALLREKRAALISHAVTRGLDADAPMKESGVAWLGRVPAHWDVRRLAMAADKITNGYVGPTRDIFVDEGVRYLQSLHIKNGEIRFEKPYFVTDEWSSEHGKSILAEGDVLIVQTGDIGQCAAVTREFIGGNCHALIVVRLKAGLGSGFYLSAFLRSDYGYNMLRLSQTGALHPHLECGKVREIQILLPPADEQERIMCYLNRETAKLDTLISKVRQHIEKLREYRAALIAAAVTGKIDVRDAGSGAERGWEGEDA